MALFSSIKLECTYFMGLGRALRMLKTTRLPEARKCQFHYFPLAKTNHKAEIG